MSPSPSYVQDLDRAKMFYEAVFQLKLERLNSPEVELWAFPMEMGRWGAGGALVKKEGVSSGGNSTII
jgi:predicted enzyme related to lactoylglutathione lyase